MGPHSLLLLLPLVCWGLAQEAPGYWLKVQELLEVQEGLCAHVSCSFSYPSPYWASEVSAYWFREEADISRDPPVATNNKQKVVSRDSKGRFHLLGDPQAQDCSLSISDARRSDKGTYFFRVEHGNVRYNYKATQLSVRVTALTQKPAIHVPEPLVSGQTGRLICSLPGACEKTSLGFSWAGEMLDPQTAASSELSLIPGPQHHGKNLSCQVTLLRTRETTEKAIRLNVSYAPQLMEVNIFYGNLTVFESHLAALKSYSWLHALKITPGRHRGPYGMLGFKPPFFCMKAALESMGNSSLLFGVTEGQSVRLVCSAPSSPPAMLSWSQDGKALNPSWPGSPEILELSPVRTTDAGMFVCRAYNPLGSMSVSVQLSIQELPTCCNCESRGSWPLVLTLIRGALMGIGFLLTYGLTWIYYSRCGGTRTRTQ